MATNRTFTMIKPDAVQNGHAGKILDQMTEAGFKVVALKYMQLDESTAGNFYGVHRERPFFADLVAFMTSGPVSVQVLEGENAIMTNRDLMGATNPKEAAAGTIRADFAESIDANAAHGSDSAESAAREVAYFFADNEICSR